MSGYVYFVSYAHERGFGNAEIGRSQPITDQGDTTDIGALIAETNRWPAGSVIVLNFQLLRGPDGAR